MSFREALKELTDDELDRVHYEYEQWCKVGTLEEDTLLRRLWSYAGELPYRISFCAEPLLTEMVERQKNLLVEYRRIFDSVISEEKIRQWIVDQQPIYQDERRSPFGQGQIGILRALEDALDKKEFEEKGEITNDN